MRPVHRCPAGVNEKKTTRMEGLSVVGGVKDRREDCVVADVGAATFLFFPTRNCRLQAANRH